MHRSIFLSNNETGCVPEPWTGSSGQAGEQIHLIVLGAEGAGPGEGVSQWADTAF